MQNKHKRPAAFFDMDGTLCAPRFIQSDGQGVLGFAYDEWVEYCEKTQEHAYDNCPLIRPTVDYAKRKKEEGYAVYILTIACSEGEKTAKRHYVKEHGLDNVFDDIIFVNGDNEKIPFVEKYAENYGIDVRACVIVEDTLGTLFEARAKDIQSVHISNIFTDSVTK